MAIIDLFSKRQKRMRAKPHDVFIYDDIPAKLRVQVVHILRDALGLPNRYLPRIEEAYRWIHDALAREYGVFRLVGHPDPAEALFQFFLEKADCNEALDVIEISFLYVDRIARTDRYRWENDAIRVDPDSAIDELNKRFLEHGVGYRYENGKLMRNDSEFLHVESVKPALDILRAKHFAGANAEFLKAHEHYRHGRQEEALNECLKAFESTMKAICAKRGWAYQQSDPAKKLLDVCFASGLVPSYLQSEFTALRACLESGVPTVRNKQAGHGQGVQPRTVPQHLAGFLLHLTASNIVFLANCEKSLP